MAADTGAASTITFSSSTASGNARLIGGHTEELGKVEINSLGLTGHKEYIPGDLIDPGEFDVEFEFDSAVVPPGIGTVETITVTYPDGTDNIAGTGFIRAIKMPDLQNEELQVAVLTCAWDGKTGPTFATT